MNIDLSVIIVSYNTCELTLQAISTVITSLKKSTFQNSPLSYEILVVDNNSSDGSFGTLQKIAQKDAQIRVFLNEKNLGFGAANNIGIKKAHGDYILLLNSDVIADKVNFGELIANMENNPHIGAMTVRVELPSGRIDPASHRGFPTAWRSFCYFSGLEKLSKYVAFLRPYFGGYHLTDQSLKTIHSIDAPAAAFYLTRKDILQKINGFDEDYFMYGEDVDLSYRIKKLGYDILWYPQFTVIHLKHQSGLKKKNNSQQRVNTKHHFYNAMRIFYDKHYAKDNNKLINALVHLGITLRSKL